VSDIETLQQRFEAMLLDCEKRLQALEGSRAHSVTSESKPVTDNEKSPEAKNRNRAKNRAANQAALQQLCEAYPEVFNRDNVRPLKIGIQEDLIADEKLARNRIKRALASYVRNPAYLKALVVGAERVGIDGQASGSVTEEEAAHATEKLDQIKQERRERQKQERQQARQRAEQEKEERLSNKLDQLLELNRKAR